jgi:hypothetical protein
MEYQIEFSYSPRFLSSAAKTFWLHDYGMSYVCYVGVLLLAFVLCLTSTEIMSSRAGTGFLGFLLGVTATVGFQFLYQFISFDKAALAAAQKWIGVKVIYKFDEVGIAAESELFSGSYTWKMVGELRQTPKAWLLFSGEQDYVALPAELLHEELKQFLTRKVIEAGGKVE